MNTLGLDLIVGDGTEFELERCLRSATTKVDDFPLLFDEIVIVATGRSRKVRSIAKKYEARIVEFPWIRDFSAARNFALDQMTADFVMWLDDDDIIKKESLRRLLELKPQLEKYDVIELPYYYGHDAEDKPLDILPRERIWRRSLKTIRWEGRVHEATNYQFVDAKIERRDDIVIDHYRMKPFNPERNISILAEMYAENPSTRTTFYYGRELFESGRPEGLSILEEFVKKGEGSNDDLVVACKKLAFYYYDKKDYEAVKRLSLRALTLSKQYAEFYVLLGNVFQFENQIDLAIQYNEEALTKKFDAGFSQTPEYYSFWPAVNLSVLYDRKGDREASFRCNAIALDWDPLNVELINDRKFLLNHIKFSVVWLIPHLDLAFPTTRIRRYNVHTKMREFGVNSDILVDYRESKSFDLIKSYSVAIFTQFSSVDLEIARRAKAAGVKIVFDFCEQLFDQECQKECIALADAVVCCSTRLSELTAQEFGSRNLSVIKDAIEPRSVTHVFERPEDHKLKAVFMGMGGNAENVTELKPIVEKAGYELVTITEWDDATIKWSLGTWHLDMNNCDVALCPQKVELQSAKSNVKITTAMALGLPVIASPIPAYEEIIRHDVNGYICREKSEWAAALKALKKSEKRREISERARPYLTRYMPEAITNQWLNLCYKLTREQTQQVLLAEMPVKVQGLSSLQILPTSHRVETPVSNSLEPVDVIVVSYNNLEYLKLCIESIQADSSYPVRLIVSDAGSNVETWSYLSILKGTTILGAPEQRLNYSQACNVAIQRTSSKYFVILNSDVIVSKGWLTNLVKKMNSVPRLAACGVLSNCDRGWLHNLPMKLEKANLELVPGMKLEQLRDHFVELQEFMSRSNEAQRDKFVAQDWVAVYATIFARSAILELGAFDPQYKNGCEDRDLCIRLRKGQYAIGQALDSFVFHFGGISRGAYEVERYKEFHDEDLENHRIINEKWAKQKIAIYTGSAWERWNKQKVNEGMGGSETWAVELASAFVRKGYQVTVYNDLDVDRIVENDGVCYRHYSKFFEDLQYDFVDYLILSRTCDPLATWNVHADKAYVMIHDIWISSDANYNVRLPRVEKYAVLSEWHRDFVAQHHKIPREKIVLTANAADQTLYERLSANVKKRNKIFYSSSPDRGLRELLLLFPKIRAAVPDLELAVAYGFDNWEKAIANNASRASEFAQMEEIKTLMKQPGVTYVGRIAKEELAKHQIESKAWLYPTNFCETFCITAVESGLSHCAILSTKLAGLITTVADAGILLEGSNTDFDYQRVFVEQAIMLLTDEKHRSEWAEKAYTRMKRYTWDAAADTWIQTFSGKSSESRVETVSTTSEKKKLNLGCGNKKIEGYVGVDLFKGPSVDEVFSIDQIPYPDKSIGGIYSEHALEHLPFLAAEKALKEWYRVLDDSAELILKIPDLELCCTSYLLATSDQHKKWYRYTIFGIQKSQAGEPDNAQIHQSGYSKQEIRELLESIGFKITSLSNYDGWDTPSIEIHAKK